MNAGQQVTSRGTRVSVANLQHRQPIHTTESVWGTELELSIW